MPAPLPPIPPAIFDSDPPRYRKVVKPISKRLAKQRLRDQAQSIRARIAALRQELAELLSKPLDTEIATFERIHPGDPEYTNAPLFG